MTRAWLLLCGRRPELPGFTITCNENHVATRSWCESYLPPGESIFLPLKRCRMRR